MTQQLSLHNTEYITILKTKNIVYVTLWDLSFIGTTEVNKNQTDRK